jgi:hypothetical protein
MKNLGLSVRYSREEVHDIFSPDTVFTPRTGAWGLRGIVAAPYRKYDYVFFVTYGQKQGQHEFKEDITDDGVLAWQSQPSQGLQSKQIQSFINHNELTSNIYLFLRTKAGTDYQYMGKLKYLNHNPTREKPVYFEWQLLDWDNVDYDKSIKITKTNAIKEAALDQLNELTESELPKSKPINDGKKSKSFDKRAKPDWSKQESNNRDLGLKGELLVLNYEKQGLINKGLPELAGKIQHTSVEEGDGAGYDIRSLSSNKETIFIEVKTTKGSKSTPFYMSSNEVKFANSHKDSYKIYRVYNYNDKTNSGKFFIIEGDAVSELNYEPTQYRVNV